MELEAWEQHPMLPSLGGWQEKRAGCPQDGMRRHHLSSQGGSQHPFSLLPWCPQESQPAY